MNLDTYVKEFLAITKYLEKLETTRISKGFLLQKKEIIMALLDRNKYDTADNKLRVWKGLKWIDAEHGRLTKRVSIGGQTVALVKIDLSVYQELDNIAKNGKK